MNYVNESPCKERLTRALFIDQNSVSTGNVGLVDSV